MKYYYIPSTYRGKRFGGGFSGGGVRGYGCIARGTLKGGYIRGTVVPKAVVQAVPRAKQPEVEAKIVQAETTGQPISIGKRVYNYVASKYNNLNPMAKAVLAVAAAQGINKLAGSPYANLMLKSGMQTAKNLYSKIKNSSLLNPPAYDPTMRINTDMFTTTTAVPTFDPNYLPPVPEKLPDKPSAIMRAAQSIWNGIKGTRKFLKNQYIDPMNEYSFGNGYGGGMRGRLRKGSPEAKAYMARLRAMRRGKRGKGIIGLGFPKGVSPGQLKNALKVARDLGQDTVTIGDKTMPYSTALKIQQGYTKMQNFWKNHDHRDFVRPKYSKKWKYMTEPRYAAVLNNLRNRMIEEMQGKWLVPQTNTAKKMKRTLKKWKRFQKGTEEAKRHMAKLRAMRKKKNQPPEVEDFSVYDNVLPPNYDGYESPAV